MVNFKEESEWAVINVKNDDRSQILFWMANSGANADGRGLAFAKMVYRKLVKDLISGQEEVLIDSPSIPFGKDVSEVLLSGEYQSVDLSIVTASKQPHQPSKENSDRLLADMVDNILSNQPQSHYKTIDSHPLT